MKDEKLYIQTETIQQAMSIVPFIPLPSDFTFEKEFIELDMSSDLEAEDQQKLEQQFQEQMSEFLMNVSEDSFEKNDGIIEVNLEGEQVKQLIASLVVSIMEQSGEILESADIQEFEQALEEITFHNLTIKAEIEGGNMKHEDISFGMEAGEGEEKVNIQLAATNEYKSINEAIEFTMEPTEENTMTQQELEDTFNQILMESLMMSTVQ